MSDTYRSGTGGGSIIGPGLRINGDVISDGDLQIDGRVVGDVKSRTLNLGESGEVDGGIVADQLQVGGKIVGQIKARTVNLARTARVEGDILHETLSVEAGAFIEGAIRRIEAKKVEEKKPAAPIVAPEEDKKPAAGELAKPAAAEPAKLAAAEPAKPVAAESVKPAAAEPAKPVAASPAKPAGVEPAKPAGQVAPAKAAGAN